MSKKGFTLIELMIVVAIIAIIAAIAIPNLLRSRIQSNESAAIGNLRTVCGAEIAYASANNAYGDFPALTGATPPFLDGVWDGATPKQGYVITCALSGAAADNFNCVGTPSEINVTGNKGFFVDASGVIRFTPDGSAPDSTSDPIGKVG